MWGFEIRVVIFPIILSLAYLGPLSYFQIGLFTDSNLSPVAIWMASVGGTYIEGNGLYSTVWSTNLFTAGLAISLALNALVTGLIAFRIFRVVKGNTTFYENMKSLGVAGGRQVEFRYIMFVMIESGMALFSIQLARVVVTAMRIGGTGGSDSTMAAFNFIVNWHEMLNVTKTTPYPLLTYFYWYCGLG